MHHYFKFQCDQCEKTTRTHVSKMHKGSEFTSKECHSHYPTEDSRYTSSTATTLQDFILKNHKKKTCPVPKTIVLYFSLIRIEFIL